MYIFCIQTYKQTTLPWHSLNDTETTTNDDKDTSNGIDHAQEIGIVIGVVAGMALFTIFCVFIIWRRQKQEEKKSHKQDRNNKKIESNYHRNNNKKSYKHKPLSTNESADDTDDDLFLRQEKRKLSSQGIHKKHMQLCRTSHFPHMIQFTVH